MDYSCKKRSWNFPGDLVVILSIPAAIIVSGVLLTRLGPVWFSLFFDVMALAYFALAWRSFREAHPLRYWRTATFAVLGIMILLLGSSALFIKTHAP